MTIGAPLSPQVCYALPNRADALLLMGAIHYQLKNYEQCVAYNDKCIVVDPGLAEAHANLANALQQLGNIDMAIVYYQVSLDARIWPCSLAQCATCTRCMF